MNLQTDLARSYIAERQACGFKRSAAQCLATARTKEPPKYTVYSRILPANFGAAGAPFMQGRRALRWIESPESCFRFVGAVHTIARREGWRGRDWDTIGYYVDTFEHETTTPVVYQLTGRDGAPRYIAGGHDPFNGDKDGRGAAYLELESYPDLIAACNAAQCIAERYAEEARDYDSAWQNGARAGEAIAEAAEQRKEALELCAERRALRAIVQPAQFPAACTALANDIRELWRDSRRAIRKAAKLREETESAARWRPELLDAFKEGLGNA